VKSPLITALTLSLGVVLSAVPGSACSNASLTGGYGFRLIGTNTVGLAAVVGQITADGNGNLAGSETVSSDGTISASVPVLGSYSIKSNCTGTAMLNPAGMSTAKYNLVIVSSGKRMEMIDVDTGITESGYALAQGSSPCTVASFKGVFGFDGGGFNSSLIPTAFSGQAKLDGAGNLSGSETASGGGAFTSGPISGSYSVNSDCTGSLTGTFNNKTFHDYVVIVNGNQASLQIDTDAGQIVTGFATKQ